MIVLPRLLYSSWQCYGCGRTNWNFFIRVGLVAEASHCVLAKHFISFFYFRGVTNERNESNVLAERWGTELRVFCSYCFCLCWCAVTQEHDPTSMRILCIAVKGSGERLDWTGLDREMSVSFYLSVVVLSVVFFLFVLFLFVSMCVEYATDCRQRRESELQRRQQLLSVWDIDLVLVAVSDW